MAASKNSQVKPLIGINADFRPANRDHGCLAWCNGGYFEHVEEAGGVPMVLIPSMDDDALRRVLETLDGVLLTGCRLDLDPVRMGFDPHPVTRAMPSQREDFDRRLAEMCYEMKVPVMAIGAGMQTLNVVCGGSLFQHIPEDVLRPLHHRDPVEKCLRHIIEIVPGTRLDHIYGPGEIRVNSDHHMAIDQLGHPFRVSATAPDGVIEAFESAMQDWFVLATQWHPESETASALDMQVFESFIEAAAEVANPVVEEEPVAEPSVAEEQPATIPMSAAFAA